MHECEICGNTFEIECPKQGEHYNDFGYRYCPFCSTRYDTLTNDEQLLTQPSN